MAITLQLEIEGKEKTFVAPSPKARMIRNAIAMTESMDQTKLRMADLDSMTNFVVDVFDKKFSVDELYDGISAENYVPTLMRIINELVEGMKSPNAQTAVQKA
jgi:predicted secreted Zn-dependent protease